MSYRSEVTQMIDSVPITERENHPKVSSYYGSNTFNELTMKKVLS